MFGSLLFTTEASNVQASVDSILSDPTPSAAAAETEDKDDTVPDEGNSSHDEHEQPFAKTLKGNGQASVAKQRRPFLTLE